MRKYKRQLGARTYRNYTQETLKDAVQMILSKKISLRGASERFNIHRNTLWLKVREAKGKKQPSKKPGRQPIFNEEEEASFVAHAVALSSFGFPMTTFDLRCAVKSYLDRTGRRVKQFKNDNFPGKDWALAFMKRHKDEISQRMSKNITYARAATNAEVINMFFENLEKELEGVPPENIWNYDETNLMDDPGSKKVITRRGAKYPEQIQNASKANTSIMVCGNAAGELLPIYVNYKAEKMWTTWTENGPEGARYNRSKSGWFDQNVFEDWFVSHLLPRLKRQDGKKALIGDNLSSHINLEILKLCEENNIKFIALPPNATRLLQPLDVAYFRPMKTVWRKVLTEWKKSTSGSRCTNVPKDEFPGLLKSLMTELSKGTETNLKSGFRKTGIYPLDKQQILQRLPQSVLEESLESIPGTVGDVFLEELNKKRDEVTAKRGPKRRKKVEIMPGRSISAGEVEEVLKKAAEEAAAKKTRKAGGRKKKPRKKGPQKRSARVEESDSEASERRWSEEDPSDPSEICETFSDLESGRNSDSEAGSPSAATKPAANVHKNGASQVTFKEDDFVVVNFEGDLFPGRVTAVEPEGYMVSVMEKTKLNRYWKWPDREDNILYEKDEILFQIAVPELVRRGLFAIKELD